MADPVTGFIIGQGVLGLVNFGANIISGNQKAKEAKRQAELDDQQADEILRRADESKEFMLKQDTTEVGNTVSGFAKAGVGLAGSALDVLEDQQYWMKREIRESQRESVFEAEQVRAGAQSLRDSAGTYKTIGYLGGAGSLLSSGASIYNKVNNTNSGKYTPTTGGG